MGQIYTPQQEAAWNEAERLAEAAIARANALIKARCTEVGIPERFQPSVDHYWCGRGFENYDKERRKELRGMARTRIEAIEQKAITEIQLASVEAQTALARASLSSEAAIAFLHKLPTIESLMPALSFEAVAGKAEPPVAEQLVSPGALRQRRYRERHRNAEVTSRNGGGATPEIEQHSDDEASQ